MRSMSRPTLLAATALSLAVLVAALSLAPAPLLAKGRTFTTVSLKVSMEGGECAIMVEPDPATIFREKPPLKVEWQSMATEDLFWEIRWEEDKAQGQVDYFDNSMPIDIPCGEVDFKSKEPKGMREVEPFWPYKVIVYACVDGDKGAKLCELDPKVDWGD